MGASTLVPLGAPLDIAVAGAAGERVVVEAGGGCKDTTAGGEMVALAPAAAGAGISAVARRPHPG